MKFQSINNGIINVDTYMSYIPTNALTYANTFLVAIATPAIANAMAILKIFLFHVFTYQRKNDSVSQLSVIMSCIVEVMTSSGSYVTFEILW